MRPNVYLTGFMGTGKSAVGRALARRLRRPFTDLDAAVEKAAGLPVAEVFARRGEAAFRRLERRALARAAARGGAVVALGGGALLDPRNRALAARTGTVVRLTCSRRELVRRLRRSRAERPLLDGGPLDARVKRLLAARRGAYGGARFAVSTTRLSHAAAAAAIARRLP
jgi:shikimate kinase